MPKTDPVRFKWGFGEVLLKDRFASKSLIKVLYLRGEKCLQNAHFYRQKGPIFKTPLNWTESVCPLLTKKTKKCEINSVQTRCIVKGEAQKSPLFWRFSGGFWFSEDRLFSRNSPRKPLNLVKSPIFTNAPCKTACLYNAPSMHTVDENLRKNCEFGSDCPFEFVPLSYYVETFIGEFFRETLLWEHLGLTDKTASTECTNEVCIVKARLTEVHFSGDFWGVWFLKNVSVATPAEPRGEKNLLLCKFWVVKNV